MCTGILLGYNLTETTNMMDEYDSHVLTGSSLNELTKYVRMGVYFVSTAI